MIDDVLKYLQKTNLSKLKVLFDSFEAPKSICIKKSEEFFSDILKYKTLIFFLSPRNPVLHLGG
jgi:hypothetical protein